jgi:hypothetical protein
MTAEQVKANVVSKVTGVAPRDYFATEPARFADAIGKEIAQALHSRPAQSASYPTKEPRLKELDALSQKYYDRPFVELDVDKRNELREELTDSDPEPAPEKTAHTVELEEALESYKLGFSNVLVYRVFKALEARLAVLEGRL